MTYLQVTEYPNSTLQPGLISNIVVGAASADVALADGNDFTYLWLNARASLDDQVARVSVTAPILPSTARVFSVDVSVRILSVPDDTPQPLLLLGLRTQSGAVAVDGQLAPPETTEFSQYAPTDAEGGTWYTLELGSFIAAPDGTPWDATPVTGNLANLSCNLGRGDDVAANLRVAGISFTVNWQEAATVTVTAPTTPSSDTQPTVQWLYGSANFAPQQASRKAVYTQDQTADLDFVPFVTPAKFISGLRGASAASSWWELGPRQQWTVPGDLTDDTYVAFVQATSQWAGAGGDFVTAISSITWTRVAAPAGPPATAVLDSAAYSYPDKRTLITCHPGGASPATVAFTVEKNTDGTDGGWAAASPRLTRFAANGMTPVTVSDRFPLLNQPTQYRVIAYSGAPLVAAAAPSNTITVTPADDRHLLHHPTNDLLDSEFDIKSPKGDEGIPVTLLEMQALYYYSGGPQTEALPGMTWGPTYGRQYGLKLWFDMIGKPTLWAAIEQLRKARCPLYWQLPTGEAMWVGMGPGATGQDTKDAVDVVPGNASVYQWKRREVVFTEINAPVDF